MSVVNAFMGEEGWIFAPDDGVIADTVAMDYFKVHSYGSHETINPTRIIPVGPVIDFTSEHGREQLI